MKNIFQQILNLIQETDLHKKCTLTTNLYNDVVNQIPFDYTPIKVISILKPGSPEKPNLVAPLKVPKRKLGSKEGHASLFHALAHIEFNAINLALDACYRFQEMPREYYLNWLEVAKDEVYHFQLLEQHLSKLGYSYGDFDAHNGLWEMALKTEHDCLARMAMVPRVLEARGIDAVPEMQQKITQLNDIDGNKILSIIHQDEITHVSYGDKWYKYLCLQASLDPENTFFELFNRYNAPKIRGAFNRQDRKKAGFSDQELDHLYNLARN